MRRRTIAAWISIGMLACWILTISLGLLMLEAHSLRPGDRGNPRDHWPAGSTLRLDGSRPTLLIFLHPKCPCSHASLAELAGIMARCRGQISARAVVFRPARVSEDWASSGPGIERDLIDLPDIPSYDDKDGDEARRFGVSTSGHVLLFDEEGRRIFGGGITPSRGHEGENRGRDEVVALILDRAGRGKRPFLPAPPVFGCPIVRPRPPDDRAVPSSALARSPAPGPRNPESGSRKTGGSTVPR